MYSIRPHSSNTIDLNLPTTMYSVKPIIEQTNTTQTMNESALADIKKRQDTLLERIEYLYNQVLLYQNTTANQANREELVIHLQATKPSTAILDLIGQFRNQLSIRTFRHSSLTDNLIYSQMPKFSTSNNSNQSLTIIWADGDNLPSMFHSHMQINDEQQIVNLLSHHFTNTK